MRQRLPVINNHPMHNIWEHRKIPQHCGYHSPIKPMNQNARIEIKSPRFFQLSIYLVLGDFLSSWFQIVFTVRNFCSQPISFLPHF
jgi:hypothetical protein